MIAGPVLDKYSASPFTLFTTDKCPITTVDITDTSDNSLITGLTALPSDVTQY